MTAAWLLAACALLQHGGATPHVPEVKSASKEALEAMAGFRVPPGFRVELWAAEPLLANPVAFHVDHQGVGYVAETFRHHAGTPDLRDHMEWLEEELANDTVEERVAMYRRHAGDEFEALYAVEHERVRRVVDTDGDGVADAATVFADAFDDPATGLGAGVLSYRGDVFYTCIPDLWRLRDRDGDGVAEERESLLYGFGVKTAMIGHDLHGLVVGPDGRLYFSSGDRGFHVRTKEDRDIEHTNGGAVLRCELDGTRLEVFHTGLRNPQELAFDAYGNLFTGDNNSDGGDQARWVQVVEGGDSGWRYGYQWIQEPNSRGPWNDEKLWYPHFEGQAAYLVPPIANLGAGPSGLTFDTGTGFPEAYRDHFFLCDFRGDPTISGVRAFDLVPRGAGFELGEVEEFAWGALATDVDFGPDGALYFSDWVSGWEKTGKGRLYRVVHEDAEADTVVARTRALLHAGFAQRGDEELEELLYHPDRRVRQEAHLELAWRGERSPLTRAANQHDNLFARLHGIWGLGVIARGDATALANLRPLLRDPAAEVRAQTAKVLGDARNRDAREWVTPLLGDESARVQFLAAQALANLRDNKPAAFAAVELAASLGESDPVLRHALCRVIANCGDAEVWGGMLESDEVFGRLATVVALRHNRDVRVRDFLNDEDPRVVLEVARAINDLPLVKAYPQLARLVARPTATGNALVRRALNANLRLGGRENAEALAAFALDDAREERHRREALEHLAVWRQPPGADRVMGDWRPLEPRDVSFLPTLIADLHELGIGGAPASVAEAWIDLATTYARTEQAPALAEWARDAQRPTSTRLAALDALEQLAFDDLPTLLRELGSDPEGRIRAACLAAVQRVAPEDALPLIERALAEGDRNELRAAYRALAGLPGEDAEKLLSAQVDRLTKGRIASELALDLVLAAEQHGSNLLRDQLVARDAVREDDDPKLAPWLDVLFGGDAERGRKLFHEKAETLCIRCHPVSETEATYVGPNLMGLPQRATRLQMLESIVDPNRRITPGYGQWRFLLDDERLVFGRILDEQGGRVRIQDADGQILEVAADTIVERTPSISSMPENQSDFLTRLEMRDLLEYLGSL